MKTYRITYEQTELRECFVTAESESAARQAFIDQDVENDHLIEVVSTFNKVVEEVDPS